VRGHQERLEEARSTSTAVGFAFDAFSYDADTGAAVLAAALAFRVFLFQVPYVCVFVIGAAYVTDLTGHDATAYFHGRGITHLTAQSVSNAAALSGWARFSALLLALYALFLSARAFVKVVNIVHALVWGVPRARVQRASRAAFLFVAVMTALLALSLAIAALRQRVLIGGIVALVLYTVAPFLLWWFVSWRLPHRPCPLIALAPGAALFAIGVELLQLVTVVWFPHYLASKSEVYGAIGIAIVLLLWAYLIGRIVTLAAVLNAALWARFGADSAHLLELRRPSRRIPLIDDKLSRIWNALFRVDVSETARGSAPAEDGDSGSR
jgi:membrane protein